MSSNIKLTILAREKEEARNIVKEILNFGVNNGQIYDIYFLIQQ